MREEYNAKITFLSDDSLSHKQKVMLKDLTDALMINTITRDSAEPLIIHPDIWAQIDVHNEHSEDKDYKKYVIIDKDGTKYQTGSESFWNAFTDIMAEMKDCDEEFGIKVYRKPSSNRDGQDFISCSVI